MRMLILFLAALFVPTVTSSAVTPAAQRDGFIGPGRYEIITPSGKVLDLNNRDMRTVQQWDRGGVRNQQWDIVNAGGNFYFIRSAENGASLGIEAAGEGARVVATRGNRQNDAWRFEGMRNGTVMIIHRSGFVLDLPNSVGDNGVPMQVWSNARNNNQMFRLVRVGDSDAAYGRRNQNSYDRDDNNRRPGADDRRAEYNEGYRAGVSDSRSNLNPNYRRHSQRFDRFTESEFREGYSAGYDNARNVNRRNEDNYDSDLDRMSQFERRNYDEGYRLGQIDARSGSNLNYRRYIDRFDRQQEPFFRRGYEAGYNSIRRF
jgi:Ricin-type beta-trefoil lectin domain-like